MKIKNFATVVNGATPSTEHPEYYDGQIIWVTPKDLSDQNAKYIWHGERNITEKGFQRCSTKILPRGSVLMSSRAPIGLLAIAANPCCTNQGIKGFDIDTSICNPEYLYYYLRYHIKEIESLGSGTTFKEVSKESMQEYDVILPNIDEQNGIVSILKAIDDKIINNSAICTKLEGMAKLLYDYWFIQFDFPDENGNPYKSSGGKMVWNEELKREIPEGWSNGCVSDLGSVVTGGTPSTEYNEYFTTDGYAWATPKDLSLLNGRFYFHGATDITEAGLKNSACNLMPEGSILFTTRAPIGYIAITANPACTNQGFKSVVPLPEYGTEFVFQTMKTLVPQMQRVGVGSTFKEVSKDVFSSQAVVLPKKKILESYGKKTQVIQEILKSIQQKNSRLVSLRDFLLPVLMNGQVKVKGV